MNVDLIIIGAGPGGYECAVRAAREGMSVVIIEQRAPGGTCLNEGCIPTKCFCHNAEVLETLRSSARYGLALDAIPSIDMSAVVSRKEEVVAQLAEGIRSLMQMPGITYINGTARFVDAHTVAVEDERYSASAIIIATGSHTKFLPIPGVHLPGVLTSSDMLCLKELPRRLCIIGGGVIGLEFASIFATFGSQVSVVEYCKEVLPNFDRDLAKRLRTSLKKRGIDLKTGAAVTAIREGEVDTPLQVDYEVKGKIVTLETDIVLMAVGRAANIDTLNLSDVGIAFTPRGITVNENMETSVSGIYAVGDVNGLCQLAHAATFQSYRALAHIQGKEDHTNLSIVPAAVFTFPEAAMVGYTEESAETAGIDYKVHKAFYRANGKALTMDAGEGFVKLLTDAEDRLIGAHILGAHASDLIHEISTLMTLSATRSDIAAAIHAHPSLSEILLAAAEN